MTDARYILQVINTLKIAFIVLLYCISYYFYPCQQTLYHYDAMGVKEGTKINGENTLKHVCFLCLHVFQHESTKLTFPSEFSAYFYPHYSCHKWSIMLLVHVCVDVEVHVRVVFLTSKGIVHVYT